MLEPAFVEPFIIKMFYPFWHSGGLLGTKMGISLKKSLFELSYFQTFNFTEFRCFYKTYVILIVTFECIFTVGSQLLFFRFPEQFFIYAQNILDGMEYLRKQGIIHR